MNILNAGASEKLAQTYALMLRDILESTKVEDI